MEIKQYNVKNAIVSQLPLVELFNERIIHNKVQYNKFDFIRVIPKGSKGFLVFKKNNCDSLCYFIELLSKRAMCKKNNLYIKSSNGKLNINRIFKLNACFDEMLTCGTGTVMFGTMCWNNNINIKSNLKYFVAENLLYYKGSRVKFNGWQNLYNNIMTCFDNIKNLGFSSNNLIVSLPVTKQLPFNIVECINTLEYDVYCIHYINSKNDYYYSKTISKKNKQYIYVKADIQNDIYELFDCDNMKVGVCHIPDYKTSIMMNTIFRNIKENNNIDYIEESDDEIDFENEEYDKYVDLEKKELFECIYNNKFNMWIPIKHIHINKHNKDKYNIYKIKC